MTALGDYELIAVIGTGTTSEVWRARQRGGLGRIVAVKRLRAPVSAGERSRLRAEAEVLDDLDHPHILRVLDVLDDDRFGPGGLAIVLSFAPGGTLADLLAERAGSGQAGLGPGAAVAIGAPLADALASAHRRGVVHGDVKPANVLFTSGGEPLLADFGARRAEGHGELTPEYAAPEALAGRDTEAPADVYSLAATLVEALTGAPPAARVRNDASSGGVAAVLRSALVADPQERPTAEQLARALRSAVPPDEVVLPAPAQQRLATSPGTRSFGPEPPRPSAPPRRIPRPWLLGLAAIAVAGALIYVARPDDGAECPPVEATPTPGSQIDRGDFDGDGCESPVVFTPSAPGGTGVLRVEVGESAPFEAAIGGPDDELFVGDWDCDGRDRPALYRTTDRTAVYLEVLEIGAPSTPARAVPGDGTRVEIRTDDDGCDQLVHVDP